MRHRAVHRHHQVQATHRRRRVRERGAGLAAHVHRHKLARRLGQLLAAQSFLQADQPHSFQSRQRGETLQADGALAVAAMAWVALPGDADREASAGQSLPPVLGPARVSRQVRDVSGDGFQSGPQDARQAQQWSMRVKGRQSGALRHDAVDAGTGGGEVGQDGGAFQQDGAAAAFDEGGIAEELDGISQPLLGVQQHGPAAQAAAVPQWQPNWPDGAAPIDFSLTTADLFPHLAYDPRAEMQELLNKGATQRDIIDNLNKRGLKNTKGRVWTKNGVDGYLQRHGLREMNLSIDQILLWADAHHERTGKWPNLNSGAVYEVPYKKWRTIDFDLRNGCRGLPSGSSLSRLLEEKRGVRNLMNSPPLRIKTIISWATAHYHRTGRWPTPESGAIQESPGDSWGAVNMALRQGWRGLKGGSSLSQVLATRRQRTAQSKETQPARRRSKW
jgi:hypothetical protein